MADNLACEPPSGRFFASIRGYFKMEPHGRYFAVLLRELALNEPISFCALLHLMKSKERNKWNGWNDIEKKLRAGSLEIVREYQYKSSVDGKDRRLADLSLIDDGAAKVLFEIKEFDGKSEKNPAQIKSYIDHISTDAAFIFISRYAPEPEVQKKLNARPKRHVIAIRYYEIYDALEKCATKSAPIARMICDYMEDINVAGYRQINLKEGDRDLSLFFSQQLGFPGRHGLRIRQRDGALSAIPSILSRLFGNLEVLGEWIRGAGNEKIIPIRFMRKFEIQPYFDLKKLQKDLNNHEADTSEAASFNEPSRLPTGMQSYVKGGEVSFYGSGKITVYKKISVHVDIGYSFELFTHPKKTKNKARQPLNCSLSLYSRFWYNDINCDEPFESITLTKFPNEAEAQKFFKDLLQKSLRSAKKNSSGLTKNTLDKFQIPTASHTNDKS